MLNQLDQTTASGDLIYLPAISVVEIFYLVERSRLPEVLLTRITANLLAQDGAIAIAPLDWWVAQAVGKIDRATVSEMPDRIIAATALALGLPLVTRDHKIQALTLIKTVW